MSPRLSSLTAFAAGCATIIGMRAALQGVIERKLLHDLDALNAGNYVPLLGNYADDAVLRFNEGDHRWSGEHHGKEAIERFLRDFTIAGIQGEVHEFHVVGPPWCMTFFVRFDDSATSPDGTVLYSNRTVLVLRTRWGRVVEHEDFYEDTERIRLLETRLRARGIQPSTSRSSTADGSS